MTALLILATLAYAIVGALLLVGDEVRSTRDRVAFAAIVATYPLVLAGLYPPHALRRRRDKAARQERLTRRVLAGDLDPEEAYLFDGWRPDRLTLLQVQVALAEAGR